MRIDLESPPTTVSTGNSQSSDRQKLHDSARQFEAMLMTSLWKQAQEGNQDDDSDEDGETSLGGMKGPLQDLAFQNIATKAAEAGGFGIGRMIEHSLQTKLSSGHELSELGRATGTADIGAIHAYGSSGMVKTAGRD